MSNSGRFAIKHGLYGTVEYKVWIGIVYRCENPSYPDYHRYGGRGISICKEWRNDPAAFVAHVGKRPGPEYSIDRIDNNRNYEPGNMRWATKQEQNVNREIVKRYEFLGTERTIGEICELTGLARDVVRKRVHRGDRGELLGRPSRRHGQRKCSR